MRPWDRIVVAATAAIASLVTATGVRASFHLYQIDQIFSDAYGNVQYIEFTDAIASPFGDGQQFLTGHQLNSALGTSTLTYTFATDLPATVAHTTANTKFLVGTQAFANLGIVAPDYIVPNGFLFIPGGTITYVFADQVTYSALPTDGNHAIDRFGNIVIASPTNFAGATSPVNVPPPVPAGVFDIDANGAVDPLTDGVLLMRYMFGLRGSALITGAVGPNAGRNTVDAIQSYIASQVPP